MTFSNTLFITLYNLVITPYHSMLEIESSRVVTQKTPSRDVKVFFLGDHSGPRVSLFSFLWAM